MRFVRFSIVLVVALALCTSTLVSARDTRHKARGTSAFARDFQASAAAYNNPDINMDLTQLTLFTLAALNDMPSLALLWTQANLIDACRTPNSPTGIMSCTDNGYPTAISLNSDNLPSLTALNALSPLLGSLTELTSINLRFSGNLQGTLPAAWGSLSKLVNLTIVGPNALTGGLPAEWNGMSALSRLDLTFAVNLSPNASTNSTPPDWLSNLAYARITGADFGDADLPDVWFSSSSLTTLILRQAFWSGNFPASMATNTVLQTLYLQALTPSNGQLIGSGKDLPTDLSGMTALQNFGLSSHATAGAFPTVCPPNLVTLEISSAPSMTGTIPQALFDTASLTYVSLSGLAQLSGALPGPSNASDSNMITLSIDGGNFAGPVSSEWFSVPSLSSLHIANGKDMDAFELGPLPAVEDGLCQLVQLSMPAIGLSGTLPDNFFSVCPNLTFINLSGNKLGGPLPSDWSVTNGLWELDFSGNNFNGSLPLDSLWRDVAGLEFDVSDNDLTGSIPADLIINHVWSYFDISGNDFDLCSNLANFSASFNMTQDRCFFGQASNSNWCPCTNLWAGAGCLANTSVCDSFPIAPSDPNSPAYVAPPVAVPITIPPTGSTDPTAPSVTTNPSVLTPLDPSVPSGANNPDVLPTPDINPSLAVPIPAVAPPSGAATQVASVTAIVGAILAIALL